MGSAVLPRPLESLEAGTSRPSNGNEHLDFVQSAGRRPAEGRRHARCESQITYQGPIRGFNDSNTAHLGHTAVQIFAAGRGGLRRLHQAEYFVAGRSWKDFVPRALGAMMVATT